MPLLVTIPFAVPTQRDVPPSIVGYGGEFENSMSSISYDEGLLWSQEEEGLVEVDNLQQSDASFRMMVKLLLQEDKPTQNQTVKLATPPPPSVYGVPTRRSLEEDPLTTPLHLHKRRRLVSLPSQCSSDPMVSPEATHTNQPIIHNASFARLLQQQQLLPYANNFSACQRRTDETRAAIARLHAQHQQQRLIMASMNLSNTQPLHHHHLFANHYNNVASF